MAYIPIGSAADDARTTWEGRDTLPDGASAKVVKGVDFHEEFHNIQAEFDDVSADLAQAKADIVDLQNNGGGGSDPALEGRVDDLETRVSNTEQSTSQNSSDIANVTNRVGALEAIPERIRASLFYQDGIKTSHNILPNGVIQSPDNQYATRVLFANALGGNTPDHYSFSVTALSGSNPMLCTVLQIDNNFIDFSTLLWDGSNWTYAVGGVVNFSLTVVDMDS